MKKRIVEHGPCAMTGVHPKHVYPMGMVDSDGYVLLGECYGKYSNCENCEDVGCMACVFRELHDVCTWDCPSCNRGDDKNIEKIFEDEVNESEIALLHNGAQDLAYKYSNGLMNYKNFKKEILKVFEEIDGKCSCKDEECCVNCGHAPLMHKNCIMR